MRMSKPGAIPGSLMLALLCALALPVGAGAAVPGQGPTPSTKAPAAATLEQCVTAVEQVERSATFVGEMTAIPGTARMQMRIDVLERGPHAAAFRAISYPGLGQWLRAAPGVRTYKNLDKVTDLSAPAVYRAAVHFRWLNAKGRLIRAMELRTGRCQQPAPPAGTGSKTATEAVTPAAG